MKINIQSQYKNAISAIIRKGLYEIKNNTPCEFKIYKNTTQLSNEELIHRLSLIFFNNLQSQRNIVVNNKHIFVLSENEALIPTVLYFSINKFDINIEFKLKEGSSLEHSRYNSIVKFKYLKNQENQLEIEYIDCIKNNEKQNLNSAISAILSDLTRVKSELAEIAKWSNA